MVWPTRVRRRAPKHAFEDALDEAGLTPDGDLEDFIETALSNPVSAPAVGSLGDITVASGYVAPASLRRAYDAEGAPADARVVERPGEAALKLKAVLEAKAHTSQDLRRLRRRFAAGNHPDRVPTELRAEAVEAMAEVNAEIDRALKRAETS